MKKKNRNRKLAKNLNLDGEEEEIQIFPEIRVQIEFRGEDEDLITKKKTEIKDEEPKVKLRRHG